MSLSFAKSALSLGPSERVVSWCDDGLLVAEYALFDASDLVLRPAEPTIVLEAGYRTTARRALERLARSGVTPGAADDVVRALPRTVVSALARCASVRAVTNRLGAAEILDGARFSAPAGAYQGAWLDLEPLARALELPAVTVLLQALYLAAALAEVPGATMVLLSTGAALQGRRPTERTYVRPAMPSVDGLLDALSRLTPDDLAGGPHESPSREARLRPALLARLRERRDADVPPAVRAHLDALESAFAAGPAASPPPEPPEPSEPSEKSEPPAQPEPPAPAAPPAPEAAASSVTAASAAIVLHASALPSLDRLGGIVAANQARPRRYVPELVEALTLPDGAAESDLGDYELPTTPREARIVMTRLARELAREYRERHGKVLRCDVLAIEVMQQQLLRTSGASIHDREVAWQIRRHGALLSEVFARVLDGEWIDVSHKEAAYWMMKVRGDLRTRPIGCVFQFVAAGKRAGDLVGHFLELERQGRGARGGGGNLAQAARS